MLSKWLPKELIKNKYVTFLVVYFLLFGFMRIVSKPVLELDEAEIIYLSQWWFLGYGPQPPLFSWLQNLFIFVLGPNLWAIAALKALLYYLIFYFSYRIGTYFFKRTGAVLSSMILFMSLELMVHSFRHSHTLLLIAMVLMSFFFFLRFLEESNFINALLLGVSFALGVLSKYNFALFVLSLVIVVLWKKKYRIKLRSGSLWLGLLLGTLLVLPHAWWLLEHWTEVQQSVSSDMVQEDKTYGVNLLGGLKELINNSLKILTPMVLLVFAYILTRRRSLHLGSLSVHWNSFLPAQVLLVHFFLMVTLIVLGLLSEVNVRWLQPVLIFAPFILVDILRDQLETYRHDGMVKWLGIVAGLILFFHPLRYQGEKWLGLENRTHCDFEMLAHNIKKVGISHNGFVTRNYFMAGNMRMQFPSELVLCTYWRAPETIKDSMLMVVLKDNEQAAKEDQSLLKDGSCFQAWWYDMPYDD